LTRSAPWSWPQPARSPPPADPRRMIQRTVATPTGSLAASVDPGRVWRVGYRPDPWAWTPWQYAGETGCFPGRWDDPRGWFRTIYAGRELLACLLEVLARFRPTRCSKRTWPTSTRMTSTRANDPGWSRWTGCRVGKPAAQHCRASTARSPTRNQWPPCGRPSCAPRSATAWPTWTPAPSGCPRHGRSPSRSRPGCTTSMVHGTLRRRAIRVPARRRPHPVGSLRARRRPRRLRPNHRLPHHPAAPGAPRPLRSLPTSPPHLGDFNPNGARTSSSRMTNAERVGAADVGIFDCGPFDPRRAEPSVTQTATTDRRDPLGRRPDRHRRRVQGQVLFVRWPEHRGRMLR